MNRCLSYDDVLFKPQYSDIMSRSEIDISSDLGAGVSLSLPIIASPMDTVSEYDMALAMSDLGGMAIVHRYNTIKEQVGEIAHLFGSRAAAIGVTGDYVSRALALVSAGADLLCVDIAHGHHALMRQALSVLRNTLGTTVHIMAGNVATLEGVNDLADWGADSVRCNIGGGSICSTRIQTGHGMPGFQTILNCAKTDRDVKIIADGGIRSSGDIVKALAAGADAVMCGSLFAGTRETPGEIHRDGNSKWKVYRGMASKEAQTDWRGSYSSLEGVESRVPYRGPVEPLIKDIERGIRSGFSYSGARTLTELQAKATFVLQTPAGLAESNTHITQRRW